jgi:FAD linked oxidases, C-terminal domain.
VTVKVLPAPEHERSLLLSGLEDAAAVAIMCRALGSAAEVSAAAHLPAAVASLLPQGSSAATLLRLEGTTLSVAERIALLAAGAGRRRGRDGGTRVQDRLARAPRYRPVPRHGRGDLAFVPAAGRRRRRHAGDRGIGRDGGPPLLRLGRRADLAGAARRGRCRSRPDSRGAQTHGGSCHADAGPPFTARGGRCLPAPRTPALAALARRVKESFDPAGRLNPGRMYHGI